MHRGTANSVVDFSGRLLNNEVTVLNRTIFFDVLQQMALKFNDKCEQERRK